MCWCVLSLEFESSIWKTACRRLCLWRFVEWKGGGYQVFMSDLLWLVGYHKDLRKVHTGIARRHSWVSLSFCCVCPLAPCTCFPVSGGHAHQHPSQEILCLILSNMKVKKQHPVPSSYKSSQGLFFYFFISALSLALPSVCFPPFSSA
jgi:hypothetical protein